MFIPSVLLIFDNISKSWKFIYFFVPSFCHFILLLSMATLQLSLLLVILPSWNDFLLLCWLSRIVISYWYLASFDHDIVLDTRENVLFMIEGYFLEHSSIFEAHFSVCRAFAPSRSWCQSRLNSFPLGSPRFVRVFIYNIGIVIMQWTFPYFVVLFLKLSFRSPLSSPRAFSITRTWVRWCSKQT